MKHKLTMSRFGLAEQCLAWLDFEWEDRPSAATRRGTNRHRLIANFVEYGQSIDDYWGPTFMDQWRSEFALPGQRAELAFALNPITWHSRELGQFIDRKYKSGDFEISGTADVETAVDLTAVVDDFKTGSKYPYYEGQLAILGLSSALNRGLRAFRTRCLYVLDHGEIVPEIRSHEVEPVKRRVQLALTKEREPRPGEHCESMWCPARFVCPARTDSESRKEPEMAKMTLDSIETGRKRTPYWLVLYGPEGVGKTTFAAGAEKPVFLGEPGGSDHIDTNRFPSPQNWSEVKEAIVTLGTTDHEFKTLVIDTADYLEPLIFDDVCNETKPAKRSIEDFGYGKGYTKALDRWRDFIKWLDRLREVKGMHVIILAHSHLKNVRNPTGEDYEHYEMKLNPKAAQLLKEWPKAVLFANYEIHLVADEDNKRRVRAFGDGSRVVHTEHRPAFDAKNRYGLPETFPLDWATFDELASAGEPKALERLLRQVNELIPELGEANREKALASRKRNETDPQKLTSLIDWIRGTINKERNDAA